MFNRWYDNEWTPTEEGPLRIFRDSKTNLFKVVIKNNSEDLITEFMIDEDLTLQMVAGNPKFHTLEVEEDGVEEKTTISLRFSHIGVVTEFKKQFINSQFFIQRKRERLEEENK